MHILFCFAFLNLSFLTLAEPTRVFLTPSRTFGSVARQAVVTPEPCVLRTPEPCEQENSAIFDKFVDAFLVKKNLTEAFSYIDAEYIVGHPFCLDVPNFSSYLTCVKILYYKTCAINQ